MDVGTRKLLLHMCMVTAAAVLILSSSRVAAGDGEVVDQLERGSRLSAVDPVGNYLLKRRQPHDKRWSPDPVGSYLLRRRRVDPVGSYLLKD